MKKPTWVSRTWRTKFRRVALGLFTVAFIIWGVAFIRERPLLSAYSYSQEIFDRNGKLLRITLSGDEKYRVFTPLSEIPKAFKEAVLLHEDRYFYRHPGVNPWALTKAAAQTLFHSQRRMGASTITMQLARMTSTQGSKTYAGKLLQIARAIGIELVHSKDEILEAYLNLLPYGANIEGIGAASLIDFGKLPMSLTLPESLGLALIPQNPNLRSLELAIEGKSQLMRSRQLLLAEWLKRHPEDRSLALDAEVQLNIRKIKALPFRAPHFVNLLIEKTAALPWQKRGHVETTLDLTLQEMLEAKTRNYVRSFKRMGIRNAAAMIVNHQTMEVVAMVGSAGFFDSEINGQFNGTLGKRSPGSSLKPLTYALALDQGLIHPLTLLKDTPMSFGGFDPENFDRSFAGPINATDALVHSRNIPAVYLSSLLKNPTLYEFLKTAGVTHLKDPSYYGLSLTLGGSEVTMEELTRLYSVLANRGELKRLRYLKTDPLQTETQLLSPEAAFLTLDMLRTNARNDQKYAESWMRDNVPVAWKTGTSHGYRDAWTTGVVGPYVISVWLGNFDGEANPSLIGRELAAPFFFSVVDALKPQAKGQPTWASHLGLNVKKVKVCPISGSIPGQHCHHQIEAWFIPGKSPIAKCDIHREISVSMATGLRSCNEDAPHSRKEVFEFWPSDLLQVFKTAGIPRKIPPVFEPGCRASETHVGGLAPSIVSPRREVVYSLRVKDRGSPEIVPLSAIADGDAHHLHWFIGAKYLGKTEPHKPLLWTPKPGHAVVRVVDDLGRSDSREIDVRVTR